MSSVRLFLNWVGRVLAGALFRLEIAGLEHVPADGPAILMANHINFADVCLLVVLMPREPVGLAKEELVRHPLLGLPLQAMGVIPIKRGEVDREALRRCQVVLAEGRRMLLIAPEGHRSGRGQLQTAHDGVTFIALRAGATVVPVGVIGVERFWRSLLTLHKTRAEIRVGPGFRFAPKGAKIDRNLLRAMTTEAMYRLAMLLPPEYRGVYSDLSRATTEHLEFE